MQVIAGYDANDGASSHEPVPDFLDQIDRGIEGLRVGVVSAAEGAPVDPEVRRALDASIEVLHALGAVPVPVRLENLKLWFNLAETIAKCEGATIHRKWLSERPHDYSDHVRTRIEAGLAIPATRYIEALSQRGPQLKTFLDAVMGSIDVLHCPAIPVPVPTIVETDLEGTGEAVLALVGRITSYTRPFNFLGVPALSVPCGFTENGLPVAFQVVGRPFAEALLLRVAASYQAATDVHLRVPEVPQG
jgi:aspartyl-tRNA(Asn)/glutamyl-tRNA(Gln) amidotransferase subunit A